MFCLGWGQKTSKQLGSSDFWPLYLPARRLSGASPLYLDWYHSWDREWSITLRLRSKMIHKADIDIKNDAYGWQMGLKLIIITIYFPIFYGFSAWCIIIGFNPALNLISDFDSDYDLNFRFWFRCWFQFSIIFVFCVWVCVQGCEQCWWSDTPWAQARRIYVCFFILVDASPLFFLYSSVVLLVSYCVCVFCCLLYYVCVFVFSINWVVAY